MCPVSLPDIKVNIGCGISGIPGWYNIDNSPTVLLSRLPFASRILKLPPWPREVRRHDVIRRPLPFADASVAYIYSSHTFEHFCYEDSVRVARECFRVLRPGGVLRIAVPDIAKLMADYMQDSEPLASHRFVKRLMLKSSLREVVHRGAHHQQMFDAKSLCHMLTSAGFDHPQVSEFRQSRIPEIDRLESEDRRGESLYVECVRSRA